MLMIVAHHYVVNSGLIQTIQESKDILGANLMLLFGAWGKTGINCFVLITGYFMCKSSFSLKKLIKLYLQIAFYGGGNLWDILHFRPGFVFAVQVVLVDLACQIDISWFCKLLLDILPIHTCS